MKIGILALQGDFSAHSKVLEALDVSWMEVRTARETEMVQGLIIPGGESTTLLKLLDLSLDLKQAILNLGKRGGIYGTCAGAILLARSVLNPAQDSLGLLDIRIVRNGYGRQNESFVAYGNSEGVTGPKKPEEMVFIRAPMIQEVGPKVKVLCRVNGNPVYVEQDNILVTTFHPELTDHTSVHQYFLQKCRNCL